MDLVTLWIALFGTFLGCMIVYGLMSQQLLKMRQDADKLRRDIETEMQRFRNETDSDIRQRFENTFDSMNERFSIYDSSFNRRFEETERSISSVFDRINVNNNRESLIHELENAGDKKSIRSLVERYI
jgi:CRP-like cAMP-binding protein